MPESKKQRAYIDKSSDAEASPNFRLNARLLLECGFLNNNDLKDESVRRVLRLARVENLRQLLRAGLLKREDIYDYKIAYILETAVPDTVRYLLELNWLDANSIKEDQMMWLLRDIKTENLIFLVEMGFVDKEGFLSNKTVHKVLETARPENLKYLLAVLQWVDADNFGDPAVLSVLRVAKLENLKYLADTALLNKSNFADDIAREALSSVDLKDLRRVLEREDLQLGSKAVSVENTLRIVLSRAHLYRHAHTLTIALAVYEDYDGDVDHLDMQIREAISQIKKTNAKWQQLSLEEQMRVLIDYFVNFERFDNETYPPLDHEEKSKNIKAISKWKSNEESDENILYFYVRQGHGEICSLRASIVARTLQKWISSAKSKVFTKIKVVPYDRYYPAAIELFGIELCKVKGDKFRSLSLTGDIMGLTNYNTKEHSGEHALACCAISPAIDSSKHSLDYPPIVVPLLFDVRDELSLQPATRSGQKCSKSTYTLPFSPGGILEGRTLDEAPVKKIVEDSRNLMRIPELIIEATVRWEKAILKKLRS